MWAKESVWVLGCMLVLGRAYPWAWRLVCESRLESGYEWE